jgi:hypothetical protein
MENFAQRRNGRKFDVIVQRNLICWNWDLPDIWIFGLLIKNFVRRRNGRKFGVVVKLNLFLSELGFARFWDFWIAN